MTCIADANVLFPLLVQGHGAHDVAQGWWGEQPDGTVGTCLLTRLAVLRLLTNRVAMNGAPVTPNEALKAWRRLADDPRSVCVAAEPAAHEPRLAMSLDYELTTFDRGFKSIRGLKLRLLTMPDR